MRAIRILTFLACLFVALASTRCAKHETASLATLNAGHTGYEIYCKNVPATPSPAPWATPNPDPLPATLPYFTVPIELQGCEGLGDDGPRFFSNEMPGLVSVVDCNARTVRFKSRDYQVNEISNIAPDGGFDARVLYITRLVHDLAGTENCWIRLLGHIQGKVQCPGDPMAARMDFTATWRFDETPPAVMEPPAPGMADVRNGPHCQFGSNSCTFLNNASVGCGG